MIKTRFAPSPTGFLHIGGLKTALFSYLFAKKSNGSFILRIEDTDQKRFVEGGMEQIQWSFDWAGITFDEGPAIGGPNGPYVQSERLPLYKKYCEELVQKGFAYPCFCTPERLETMREEQQKNHLAPKYDGHCCKLVKQEIEERLQKGEKHVIRMRIPENKNIVVHDLIKGDVVYNTNDLDEQVLMKSDGFPTYHLAVVVDDHLMEITHVIRADEWLPSTPKHILLYEYFGWKCPDFAHVPPVLAPGGNKKLSKREGSVSVDEFAKNGYLPEAMINYLALLGWNPGTTEEFFTLEELTKQFSLERCQKAGAVFDYKRLNWMNGQYIRRKTVGELALLIKPFIQKEAWYKDDDAYLEKAVFEIQPRIETLLESKDMLQSFYEEVPYEKNLIVNEKMKVTEEIARKSLTAMYEKFEHMDLWEKEYIQKTLLDIVQENHLTNGQVFWPLRAILSGRSSSPGAFEMAYVLGKMETLKRIEKGLKKVE
jgi:glutamyl-tRNA synthetase